MIIHSNEFIPVRFSVISNRTFLLYNFKAILCEKSHQFAEFQELFLCIELESGLFYSKYSLLIQESIIRFGSVMSIERYFLGCPIWGNKAWVGELFASDVKQKDFLSQYASVFNTVEGNTTFYGLPSEKAAMRWLADTPPGFRFALKFPRAISKRLRNAELETAAFLDVLTVLQDRVGPSFLQLPPSFGPRDLPVLDRFLDALPGTFSYAVEIRHHLFFAEAESELNAVLKSQGVDRVVFDTRGLHSTRSDDAAGREAQRKKPKVPVRFLATGRFPFVRFVGHPEVEKNLPLLKEWVPVVANWIREGRTPFVFMHAPDDFYAPQLARQFHQMLSGDIDVGEMPPWPAEQVEEAPVQMDLF